MLTKMNSQFSVLRPALLGLALTLTVLAMISPATAADCTPGQTRTIISSIECCNYPYTWVWKQDQVCCAAGVWENVNGPYCAPHSVCAI